MTTRIQNLLKAVGVFALTGICGISNAQTFEWGEAGPLYTAGRSRNIVIDKTDATNNTMYAGSASSGIFKTTNGGAKWTPVNDQGTVRNISYLAQDFSGVIWAATGEGFLRAGQKVKAQPGSGVYKLIDTTLTQVADASVVGNVINRIACSPTDANVIALATNKGILVSTNGGATFFAPAGIPTNSNVIYGMDVKFTSAGILFCTAGNERGNSPFGTVVSKVFKSTDASLTNFTEIVINSPLLADNIHGRIELAIAPSNNNIVYATVANKNTNVASDPGAASLKAVFATYDGGATPFKLVHIGSSQLDPFAPTGFIGSGDYAHVVVVHPTDPYQFYLGGYLLFRYNRTGGNDDNPLGLWTQIGQPGLPNTQLYLHQNIHDVKIVGTGSNQKLYVVTDAGIFRSIDLNNPFGIQSFQPFYSGFVTGQFNSVSIETLPLSDFSSTLSPGSAVSANDAFIGGTGGNGLTYFSGKYPNVSQETNYVGGEIYNAEFSKILPRAAFFTSGSVGAIYRTSDIRNSDPAVLTVNSYTGNLSQLGPNASAFANAGFNNTTGSPFRLWENYGQVAATPDSLVFYNDSLRVQTSVTGTANLVSQTNFTFTSGRPNKFALIDSIVIRTGTVQVEFNPNLPTPYTAADKIDISVKLASNYTTGLTPSSPPVASIVGPASAAGVTLNPTSLLDEVSISFNTPPFAAKNITTATISDPSIYYRVYATIFYKYNVGDSITLVDNNISTIVNQSTFTLSTPLRWTKTSLNSPKPYVGETNPIQKVPTKISARLAVVYNNKGVTDSKNAIVVAKAPLNLNDPLNFVRVSQSGALTTDATGASTTNTINIPGKPILLEWSKGGTELYYATDDNKLYRVSNIVTLLDLSQASYSGKLNNDIFKYGNITNPMTMSINPASPFRTTLLGTFPSTITSISIAKNDLDMVITFNATTGTRIMKNTGSIKTSDFSNINFVDKSGGTFPANVSTYCSFIEKDDPKMVFVGTDNGVVFTKDITAGSPTWANVNDGVPNDKKLPNVQVFDIKQQTMAPWECYNSGVIYAATYGRGVWSNRNFFKNYVVGVDEVSPVKKENNLSVYPNPTNGQVTVSFNGIAGETAAIQVLDINGRIVKNEPLGKLYEGQANVVFNTADLTSGIYIVNISGDSGIKRVAKLIVTK